jgi:DNA-binding HxlR family transcriptional regulator
VPLTTFVINSLKDTGYKKDSIMPTHTECKSAHQAVRDTLEVISGKWKLVILVVLMEQKMRFRELSREIKISPRILSKELQELEMNQLVKRTVCDTRPITVEYEVTEYSRTLSEVLQAMRRWGDLHHETIIGKKRPGAVAVEPVG